MLYCIASTTETIRVAASIIQLASVGFTLEKFLYSIYNKVGYGLFTLRQETRGYDF